MTWQEPTNQITLHASHDLEVAEPDIKLTKIGMDETYNSYELEKLVIYFTSFQNSSRSFES